MYGSPYEFELAFAGMQSMPTSHAAHELPSQAQRQSRRPHHQAARRHHPSLHLIDEHERLPYLAYSRFTPTRPASFIQKTRQDEQGQHSTVPGTNIPQASGRFHLPSSRPLAAGQFSHPGALSAGYTQNFSDSEPRFTNPFPPAPTQDSQGFDRHSWDPIKRYAATTDRKTDQKRQTYHELPLALRAGPPTVYHEMSAQRTPSPTLPPTYSTPKPPSMTLLTTSTSENATNKNQVEPIISPLNHSMSGASRNSTVSPLSTQPSRRLQPSISRRPLPPAPLSVIKPESSEHSSSTGSPKTPGMLTAGRFIASCRELRPSTSVLAEYEVRFGSTSKGNSPIREITTIVLDSPRVSAPAKGPESSRRRKLLNFLRRISGRKQK